MIQVIKHPNEYCFVGNPVVFEVETDSYIPISITVSSSDASITLSDYPFRTQVGYKAVIDIADVLNSFFDKESRPYDETIVIAELENFILECVVKIEDISYKLKAIDGGISNLNIEELAENGLDMFSYRLTNPERSILFTTRTNSPYIYLKETEVFPFVFLHPGTSITFVSASGNIITMPAMKKGLACLLDLNSLRKFFYELYHEITSYFELQIEGSSSSYITLTPSVLSEDKFLIRFKNSLGGYEQLELTGKAIQTTDFGEESNYQKYTDSSFFKTKRERLDFQQIITIQTGYKNRDELNFLLDLITTDRAYFIYPNGTVFECIITVEDFKVPLRITTPTSVELKITLTTKSKFYSPLIDLARPGAWILETGSWNDFASWKDNKNWID